jgi:hypothetical protein
MGGHCPGEFCRDQLAVLPVPDFQVMERGEGKEDLGTVYYAISLLILSL